MRLRKAIMEAWVGVLLAGVQAVYEVFGTNRAANVYLLTHTSQVCYMEAALNDTFDESLRRIYIIDPYSDLLLYLAMRSETAALLPYEAPLWLGTRAETGTTTYHSPRWLYTRDEALVYIGFDFFIVMPTGLGYDNARMNALVNRYRLPGRTWDVIVI